MNFKCRLCNDIVPLKELRAHLRAHNSNADGFTPEQVHCYFDETESIEEPEMGHCEQCGYELDVNWTYCPICSLEIPKGP